MVLDSVLRSLDNISSCIVDFHLDTPLSFLCRYCLELDDSYHFIREVCYLGKECRIKRCRKVFYHISLAVTLCTKLDLWRIHFDDLRSDYISASDTLLLHFLGIYHKGIFTVTLDSIKVSAVLFSERCFSLNAIQYLVHQFQSLKSIDRSTLCLRMYRLDTFKEWCLCDTEFWLSYVKSRHILIYCLIAVIGEHDVLVLGYLRLGIRYLGIDHCVIVLTNYIKVITVQLEVVGICQISLCISLVDNDKRNIHVIREAVDKVGEVVKEAVLLFLCLGKKVYVTESIELGEGVVSRNNYSVIRNALKHISDESLYCTLLHSLDRFCVLISRLNVFLFLK